MVASNLTKPLKLRFDSTKSNPDIAHFFAPTSVQATRTRDAKRTTMTDQKLTGQDVTQQVTAAANEVFDQCLEKIEHCLRQLTDEQIWWRPGEDMNSIGNLVLHLTGNVRQWIVAGLGNEEDVRDRPREFSERGPVPSDALWHDLETVVNEAKRVLAAAEPATMAGNHRIQGFDVTGWYALFDCVPHFKGHTQEIICMTRMQLGSEYQFHWQPETPEQGAPVL